jgi:alkylhydroperoxidase family enzyme
MSQPESAGPRIRLSLSQQLLALKPTTREAYLSFVANMKAENVLPAHLRELAFLRASVINDCAT